MDTPTWLFSPLDKLVNHIWFGQSHASCFPLASSPYAKLANLASSRLLCVSVQLGEWNWSSHVVKCISQHAIWRLIQLIYDSESKKQTNKKTDSQIFALCSWIIDNSKRFSGSRCKSQKVWLVWLTLDIYSSLKGLRCINSCGSTVFV